MRQDLHISFRTLANKPGFAAVVVLTLALGIGASTAIFNVMNAVILQPLPFRQPERLVHIFESYPKDGRYHRGSEQSFITVRPATYHDWAEMSPNTWVAVRTKGDPSAVAAAVLIATFGGIAAVLTAAGIYAAFSYLVSRRKQELGVRIALGARKGQIAGMVLYSVLRVTAAGIAIGSAAELLAGRVLASQFSAVRPIDGLAMAGVAVALTAVAILASLVPTIRATSADPLAALRQE